jgi:hypothetical protein
MSSAIPPVLVELQLETANIKAQMAQLNKNFESFGQTVAKQSSFMERFKVAAVGMFAGNMMTQGLNMLSSTIRGAVQEAQAYEKATAQLNAGIKSTGNLAGLSVEGLQKQASALESLSGQDEIAIMKNQGLLQTFTNVRNVVGEGNDIFDQATLAMLDMGAKMGDNAGSALQLGKALNDPLMGMNALRRVGVVFTEEQKQSIKTMMAAGDVMGAQKVILGELQTEFGGAAKAAGDTFAGAVFRAKDKVSDFARNLITGLQPILLSIGKTIGNLINTYIAPLLSLIMKNKEALLLFVGVLGAAYAAFRLYGVILAVVKTAQAAYAVAQVLMTGGQLAAIASTNGLAASMLRLNAIMRANPIGLIVTGIALLAAGFVIAWNNSETFRKVVVKGLQIVLNGVGYLVGGFATLIGTFAKIPGMGWAKGIAEGASKAADKIRDVSNGLDKLTNKKITIPGFGKTKADGTPEGGAAPGGGKTAEEIAAAKAAAKQKAKDLIKANEDVQASYEKMNKVISDAKDKGIKIESDYGKKVASINKDYADKEIAARKKYSDKAIQITKDYEEKELAIRKDFAGKAIELQVQAEEKRASIIQKSKDLLVNAFQNATKLDLASLMKDSDGSGATMVERMKEKLTKIIDLQRKAGELASKGFSQAFIQDVISQGPDAGNAMADSILSASPETTQQMQDLYGKIQNVSENGMNKLADTMYDKMGLATKALRDEYAQVAVDLARALEKNAVDFAEALATNTKDLQDALAQNQADLDEALKQIQADLTDALLAAQLAYNEAIDALEKDTKDKLASLQDELKKTADIIKELAGAKAAAAVLANSPAAPIFAGVTPTIPYTLTDALKKTGAASEGEYLRESRGLAITQNISYPSASANEISAQTLSAIKFGTSGGYSFTGSMGAR